MTPINMTPINSGLPNNQGVTESQGADKAPQGADTSKTCLSKMGVVVRNLATRACQSAQSMRAPTKIMNYLKENPAIIGTLFTALGSLGGPVGALITGGLALAGMYIMGKTEAKDVLPVLSAMLAGSLGGPVAALVVGLIVENISSNIKNAPQS